MNVQALLKSHGDDAPSGENLEYDAVFIEMEIAAQPGQERQAGDDILPAEEPEYPEVVAKALAVMERSHDLRAGVVLANGILNTEGMTGFADATSYLRGCLEQYWDSCHPQLDADDDNDPTMRINAIKGLASADTVLRSLRRVPLTISRNFGRMSLRDLQVAHGEAPAIAGQPVREKSSIIAAFEDTPEDTRLAIFEAVRTSLANLKAIDATFARETPGYGPDLDEATKSLQQMLRLMGEYVRAPVADTAPLPQDEVADMPADIQSSPAAPRPSVGGAPGRIATRDDVLAAIDALTNYYRDYEPSSPVPILLARAKRLVKADFMEILKDLAPSGVDNVNMIGGLSDRK